jgi:mono/diheme cytochrome c family protein
MQTLSKWVFICMSLLWATFSHAQRVVPAPALTAYQQECSVCHFAYPPGLLPAESWKSITDSLPKHFSTQVLLNSDTQSLIADWLQTNAVNPVWVGTQMPPDNRITRAEWWLGIHKVSKKLPAKVWKNLYVKSPSNCAACHRGAPSGEYNAKTVQISS